MDFSKIGFSNVNTAICQFDDTAKMDRCSVEVASTSVAFMLIHGGSFIKSNIARLFQRNYGIDVMSGRYVALTTL